MMIPNETKWYIPLEPSIGRATKAQLLLSLSPLVDKMLMGI